MILEIWQIQSDFIAISASPAPLKRPFTDKRRITSPMLRKTSLEKETPSVTVLALIPRKSTISDAKKQETPPISTAKTEPAR